MDDDGALASLNIDKDGVALNLRDFIAIMRARWVPACATVVTALLASVVITLLTTPLYQASTRLFVSTVAGESLSDMYQGTLFSQQRVLSYTQLLKGETLATRTIDKLGLKMSPGDLEARVTATAKPDTVLIDFKVLDESPVRARDIANTMSDEFVAMVSELETPPDGTKPDGRVIVEQRASSPGVQVVPNTARNLGLGLILGVLLGVGLALLLEFLDNTVKSGETLEEVAGAAVVGSIPLDKERRAHPAIAFGNENSASAEAFRKLRTNLQFLAVDNPPRLIVVTSSIPEEGKSTTAINIALALAEAGNNVALVDGDMRRPMLAKYLNLVGSVGFSTVLSGEAALSEVLQKSGFPGLTLLAAGSIPPNPSELLGSLAAKRVLGELRAQFDYVIVDTSPLLAVTDAAILSANSDGVLIMARFGHAKRQQVMHAVKNLRDVGATVLGAVFTMTPARGGSSYAYSYDYYGYGGDKADDLSSNSSSTGDSRTKQVGETEVDSLPVDKTIATTEQVNQDPFRVRKIPRHLRAR